MNEQEKSLKLAKLIGWCFGYQTDGKTIHIFTMSTEEGDMEGVELQPYRHSVNGLAQFAAILLEFPEVMHEISGYDACPEHGGCGESYFGIEPTQENILNEILRLNGVEI